MKVSYCEAGRYQAPADNEDCHICELGGLDGIMGHGLKQPFKTFSAHPV